MVVWPSISRLILSAVSKLGASAYGSDIVTDNWLSFGLKVNVLGEPVSTTPTVVKDTSALRIDNFNVKASDKASFFLL